MKKLLLLLALGCLVLCSCSSDVKKYVIKGHVDKSGSDLLVTMVNETGEVDTVHEVRSVNGDFEMEGVINGPKLAFLTIKGVVSKAWNIGCLCSTTGWTLCLLLCPMRLFHSAYPAIAARKSHS